MQTLILYRIWKIGQHPTCDERQGLVVVDIEPEGAIKAMTNELRHDAWLHGRPFDPENIKVQHDPDSIRALLEEVKPPVAVLERVENALGTDQSTGAPCLLADMNGWGAPRMWLIEAGEILDIGKTHEL